MVHCVYDSHKTSVLILIIISCVASYFRVLNSNFGCSVTFIFPSDSSFPSPYRRLLIRPIYTHTIYIYGWLILFGFFFFTPPHRCPPRSSDVGSRRVGKSRGEWTQRRNRPRTCDNGRNDTTATRGY